MEFGSHVWLQHIIPPIYNRVVDQVPGLTSDRVFSTLWPIEDHLRWPPADRFVTGEAHNFPVDQRMVTGGGVLNTAFDSSLVLTAYVRLDADIENRSTQQLSDEVNGVWVFVHQIIEAVHQWNGPAGPDGLQVFRRPMRISPGFQILKKSAGDRGRWAVAPMTFEVSFTADLGFSYVGGAI